MGRLVSIVLLILVIALFPPATLAVVSNNAVPGDSMYPIKRGLEDIIFAMASVNPAMRAWFAAARSDRRFQEVTLLIAQGKNAGNTLNELIEQASVAANQIDQVTDPAEKDKLVSQLSDSIDKYDAGLAQMAQTYEPATDSMKPSDQIVQQLEDSTPAPQPSIRSSARPTPKPPVSPLPEVTPLPSSGSDAQTDINKAKEELEKIKEKIKRKQEQGKENQDSRNNNFSDREKETDNRTDKLKQESGENQKKMRGVR